MKEPPRAIWARVRLGAFAILIAALVALAALSPPVFETLAQEDGWIEWATVLGYLAASVLAAATALRRATLPRLDRAALVGLAAFALFVGGEEISWGQRLFGFRPPDVFLEQNFQQESNLHNLLKNVFDSRWQVTLIAAGYGLIAPALARQRWLPKALAPDIELTPWPAAVVALEVLYPFELAGELAELALGLFFVADVAARREGRGSERGARSGVALGGAALVAALAAPPLLTLIRGSDLDRIATTRREIELLASDLEDLGAVRPNAFARSRIHKRVFTATRQGYLAFGRGSTFLEGATTPAERGGDPRRDRRGYFLDAWNQPLWIVWQRADATTGRVIVYSFGPNHRRDSHFEGPAPVVGGDDIGAQVTIDARLPR